MSWILDIKLWSSIRADQITRQACQSLKITNLPSFEMISNISGTADQYQLGDLGDKYGLVESRSYSNSYNETQVSVFGPYSILGRSVVLHRKVRFY